MSKLCPRSSAGSGRDASCFVIWVQEGAQTIYVNLFPVWERKGYSTISTSSTCGNERGIQLFQLVPRVGRVVVLNYFGGSACGAEGGSACGAEGVLQL